MYYYKARIYSPTLGRFLQTDPIGYGDGMNLYGYVSGDPVNFSDPSGLTSVEFDDIIINGRRTRAAQAAAASVVLGNHGYSFRLHDYDIVSDIVATITEDDCDTPGVDQSNCNITVNALPKPPVNRDRSRTVSRELDNLRRCAVDVGAAYLEGLGDMEGLIATTAVAIVIDAGRKLFEYNMTSGGTMGNIRLAPPGGGRKVNGTYSAEEE